MAESTVAAKPEAAVARSRMMEVYRLWWLHDARWYQGVAKRFGQEAANEINAEALRFVSAQVGRRVAKHFGSPVGAASIEQLRELYDQCSEQMFPAELRDGETRVGDDETVELVIRQSFALVMLRMAGSLEDYDCPCTDIHAGWSEGLGIELAENRAAGCLRHGDPACHLVMRVAGRCGTLCGAHSAP